MDRGVCCGGRPPYFPTFAWETVIEAAVVEMCSGGWGTGTKGLSRRGGKTDLERSPPPGLCEREKIKP